MKKILKNKKGITLIALVVTIIVLLILAGVSIAMLTGENGILTQAAKAKEQTEKAQANETNTLLNYEQYINASKSGSTVFTDDNGKIAIIPKGFYIVPGLDIIDEGLVISDIEDDTKDEGNQFVWIPVDSMENFIRRESYGSASEQVLLEDCSEVGKDGINPGFEETEDIKEEAINMYKSVEKYDGFYIGRYETGKDNLGNPVVKRGYNVYNYVSWSNYDNTDGALEISQKFYQNKDVGVTSTLCYGVQWDTALNFINNNDYIKNSFGNGWYQSNYVSGNPNHLTGVNVDNQKSNCLKNIYDMAGNVWEWTMEYYNTNQRIRRGGFYLNTGIDRPASNRLGCGITASVEEIGFRISLFIN